MKFNSTIDIKAQRDKVVAIFLDPEKQQHFQDGFISKELLSGKINEVGAKSKMLYKKLELLETVQINNLPDEFKGLYEHKHTTNTMHVKFIVLDNKTTCYTSEINYTKLNGFVVKIMAKYFPSMFKKQVEKWMLQFKNYCEAEN